MNTLESLADQILRIALSDNNRVDLTTPALQELYQRDHSAFIKALTHLESTKPPYIVQDRYSMNLKLTSEGAEFIQRGGYGGGAESC